MILIVIGELSELETKTYDDVLHTGLGVGKTAEPKAGTSNTLKQGLNPLIDEPQDEAPLDLSVEDKAVPAMQSGPVIPLDLSFGQGSDDFLLQKMTLLMDHQPHLIPCPITVHRRKSQNNRFYR